METTETLVNDLLNNEGFLRGPLAWNEAVAARIAGLPDPGDEAWTCMQTTATHA